MGGTAFSSGNWAGVVSSFSTGLFDSTDQALVAVDHQDDEYVAEEELTVIPGWQASVTLEVKEHIETGEEEEEEFYTQRAKLFRFRDGEWKERGLGPAKLL